MSENKGIVRGNTTYFGIIEIDGKFACSGCNTINPETNKTMHMDFNDRFDNSYSCLKCGNCITVSTKRTGENLLYWS